MAALEYMATSRSTFVIIFGLYIDIDLILVVVVVVVVVVAMMTEMLHCINAGSS